MNWIMTISGVLLILLALRDIFHTLWHPGGFGTIANVLFGLVWRSTRLLNRGSRSSEVAGPVGLLLTLGVWASLLVLGFALLYLPRMPQDFHFGSSLEPAASSDSVASLYLSLVALTTLGIGDIQPETPILRFLVPVQALLGFLLLTAGISWILQLYPALSRRRAFARRLTTMARQQAAGVVEAGEPSVAVQHLEAARAALAGVEVDLLQYAESYYFRESQTEVSLAAALPQVARLVVAGESSASAEVRNAALMLGDALTAFLDLLRRDFLGDHESDEATMLAFAKDHQQPPPDLD